MIPLAAYADRLSVRPGETLVVDANPAPVAAVFNMSPENGVATISTRLRINAYSHVRAIAETSDGELFMATRFVKASGGCSAPVIPKTKGTPQVSP